MTSRRNLLRAAVLGAAVCALPGVGFGADAPPPACDPANVNAADAGCKALVPRGNAAAPQSGEDSRRGTCETMDGDKIAWSQPNVPFGVARCDPTEIAPAPQEKSPQGK